MTSQERSAAARKGRATRAMQDHARGKWLCSIDNHDWKRDPLGFDICRRCLKVKHPDC